MYKLIRPLIFLRDSEKSHRAVVKLGGHLGKPALFTKIIRSLYVYEDERLSNDVFGIHFANPVGLAGGFDKNAECVPFLVSLGFGFLEVGTVTQHEQSGNPRPRIFRLEKDKALINRLGFNNDGAEIIGGRLASGGQNSIPVGISIGKSKIAPLEQATDDYLFSFRALYPYGNYFAVNVSSPNTPGLRGLQEKEMLRELLGALQKENERLGNGRGKPLLIKIAPDLSWEAIDDILEVCADKKIAGIIATNTTLSRDGLIETTTETGGLSGKPLREKSLTIVSYIHKHLPSLPIIGVGGIFSSEDAYRMLKAGASLVQIYTALIYEGPGIVKKINRGLVKLMEKDGVKSIKELQK